MDGGAGIPFEEFVAARWPALVRTAFMLTGDQGLAEDLVQTALVRAHRHWARVVSGGDPSAYVRKAIYHEHVSSWRRRFRGAEVSWDTVPEPGDGRDATAAVDEQDRLWAALRELPPRMRAAVVLRHLEGASEAETAALLGCSVGSVKSATSRGLARLRGVLGEQQLDEHEEVLR